MESDEEMVLGLGDLTGFSEDEEDGGHHTLSSPSTNIDFMASLLQASSSKPKTVKKKYTKKLKDESEENEEADISAMKERMEMMEKELSLLRQKVKSSESGQTGKVCTPSQNSRSNSSATVEKKTGSNSLKKEKRVEHSLQKTRNSVELDRNISTSLLAQRNDDKAAGVMTEKYSGLRIKNPLISSELMKERMKDRKVIKIKNVGSSVIGGDVPGDWVLIGVLVDKLPPRDDKKGKKYVIWKLSDLSSQTAIISLFLFGAAFQSHWKTSVGTVVAILNPDIVPNKEGGMSATKKTSVAVSISNDKKMMLMGVSQDYTLCKGVTKAGKKCSNFASVSDGGYCDYHISKAYERSRSNRMELQTGYGPSINRGKLKDKLFAKSKTEYFYYGGETIAVAPNSKEATSSSAGSSSRLFAPGARASATQLVADLKGQPVPNTVPNLSTSMGTAGTPTQLAKSNSVLGAKKLNTLGQRMLMESKKKKEEEPRGGKSCLPEPLTAAEMLQHYRDELPCLARGSGPGGMVDLSPRPLSAVKRKAAAILKRSRSESSEQKRKKLLDRVEQSRAVEEEEEGGDDDGGKSEKRSRTLTLDMDKILNARSSHSWLSEEADLERENEYFDRLEKKENIESKKERVTQLTVSAVHCKLCNYTAESPGELCSKQGHHLSRVKSVKKAFVCSNCNQKIFEYDVRWPVRPCSKCGSSKYNPASIYYIKKGPTLPTEELLLRGVEEKFLS